MKFVDDAKRCWRWLSVQMMSLAGVLQLSWTQLTEDQKAVLPPHTVQYVTVALLFFGIVGRCIDQSKKDAPKE